MGIRLARSLSLLAAVALVVGSLLAPARAAHPLIAALSKGESVFWHGPYVKSLQKYRKAHDCEQRCFEYKLKIVEPGARLRVALDYPMGNEFINLRLKDPRGRTIKPGATGFYSQEIFVKRPRVGTWTVSVRPFSMSKSAFRLRAKLEDAPARPAGRRILAPNLRLEPPFQFTFRPPSTVVPVTYVQGGRPKETGSCGFDEMAEESARRCLRLSVGPQNAGAGPLELRFSPVTDAATGEAPMFQLVHYANGATKERRAGTYEYHKTHGHYHFTGFARMDLFDVVDRESGELARAGKGHKSGFCFGDVMMNSWERFVHDRAASSRSSCDDFTEAYMGLSTGWTDIYTWDTPGNYVEFGDNPDGYYVVRAQVDARDTILETNENDNVSYAYIHVQGDKVRVLERGFGTDPWDPNKALVVDWVKALTRRN
ncbi:MAG: lysyl oxidase family protein [Actinomycetota bacterium]